MRLKWPDWMKFLFADRAQRPAKHNHDSENVDYIAYRLDVFMMSRKPFLHPKYSIRELSEEIGVSVHQLSSAINLRRGMNFSDYLNQHRIRYCQQLVQSGNRRINLRDLSADCGFRNRNTFTAAFKKFTGMTPSEYLKKH